MKDLKKLGKTLSRTEQKSITGGVKRPCTNPTPYYCTDTVSCPEGYLCDLMMGDPGPGSCHCPI